MRLDGAPTREPLPTASIVGHRPARGPTFPRIPFLLSRIGSVRRGRGFPVRRGSLAVPSDLRLPNARSERLGVPKPPVRASRPPRIEGVDAVRIGPNASTRRTPRLRRGRRSQRRRPWETGGIRWCSARRRRGLNVDSSAPRDVSSVLEADTRTRVPTPDQSASHALALPRTRREPQCKRGPGQVDAIVARADAATNALGSPAEHTEGCKYRHSKTPPAP